MLLSKSPLIDKVSKLVMNFYKEQKSMLSKRAKLKTSVITAWIKIYSKKAKVFFFLFHLTSNSSNVKEMWIEGTAADSEGINEKKAIETSAKHTFTTSK